MEENMSNLTCEASLFSNSSNLTQLPTKKRRNQPGHPEPGAEVIALSPRSLMATNRFVCDVCNKGFKRDQNLQLHRRGHNLPWKLKQKSKKEAGRKVYICPEIGCVHHDPSRALGDLTGIKKHFFRKHGEKKWKCEKCSKKYAVQSDWKAHSKICGTREYRCECGTLFSRRDSFVTHRAFCDALSQEAQMGAKSININKEEIPAWLSSINPSNSIWPGAYHHHQPTHFSATALLQKAAQMGAKSSSQQFPSPFTTPHQAGHVTPIQTEGFGTSRDQLVHSLASYEDKAASTTPLAHHDQMMMMTMNKNNAGFHQGRDDHVFAGGFNGTRDFLGLRPLSQNDILSLTGFDSCINSNSCDQNHNPKYW
ncbi:protein indeterminate-domain 7-like [Salvia splendens]|uniref:protein indeterminate-domain 7-like n=1 Tax=Salvia splendens TaxID=180675 RepID=UPI001C260160|nr:protein indeterminate-domain 7-like [Salvia splendens]XP_041992510.1 protein indeterminate-domain 7-like [Salvia splendens]